MLHRWQKSYVAMRCVCTYSCRVMTSELFYTGHKNIIVHVEFAWFIKLIMILMWFASSLWSTERQYLIIHMYMNACLNSLSLTMQDYCTCLCVYTCQYPQHFPHQQMWPSSWHCLLCSKRPPSCQWTAQSVHSSTCHATWNLRWGLKKQAVGMGKKSGWERREKRNTCICTQDVHKLVYILPRMYIPPQTYM